MNARHFRTLANEYEEIIDKEGWEVAALTVQQENTPADAVLILGELHRRLAVRRRADSLDRLDAAARADKNLGRSHR